MFKNLAIYALNLSVSFLNFNSIFGMVLLILILFQILSGLFLAFSLISEPMLIPQSRNEEDMEDLYIDDFFWLHERGVDFIFLFSIFHFLRKFFQTHYSDMQIFTWKTGIFSFLIIHVVIFFGLTLSCTHLSDITLTIAANIINTFTLKYGKFYWWFFTDQTLNSDSILRLMYGHYVFAFVLAYLGFLHAIEMHETWSDRWYSDYIPAKSFWGPDVFKIELLWILNFILIGSIFGFYFYKVIEALSFELFMWGDVGLIIDVRFFGVAPHWYFRSYMGWLILCPHHYMGILGLLFFLIAIYFIPQRQKNILRFKKYLNLLVTKWKRFTRFISHSIIFSSSLFFTNSLLPYGRFYHRIGGNPALADSYSYVLGYLCFRNTKRLLLNYKEQFKQIFSIFKIIFFVK